MAQKNYPSLEDFARGGVRRRQIDWHGGVVRHIREQVSAELQEEIESLKKAERVTEQDVTKSFEELREELSRMAGNQRAIAMLERLSEQRDALRGGRRSKKNFRNQFDSARIIDHFKMLKRQGLNQQKALAILATSWRVGRSTLFNILKGRS